MFNVSLIFLRHKQGYVQIFLRTVAASPSTLSAFQFGIAFHLANFLLNNPIVNQYLKSISILISGVNFYALPTRSFPKARLNFTAHFLNKWVSIFVNNNTSNSIRDVLQKHCQFLTCRCLNSKTESCFVRFKLQKQHTYANNYNSIEKADVPAINYKKAAK